MPNKYSLDANRIFCSDKAFLRKFQTRIRLRTRKTFSDFDDPTFNLFRDIHFNNIKTTWCTYNKTLSNPWTDLVRDPTYVGTSYTYFIYSTGHQT